MSSATSPLPTLHPLQYEDLLRHALREDLGGAGDITTDAIVPPDAQGVGSVVARQAGRIAGLDVALATFRLLDPAATWTVACGDGGDAVAGTELAVVRGSARALLTGERTALNLLGRMCGIATVTRDVVTSLQGLHTRVACTRKTTPGLRRLEKYAVRVGGGSEHRFGLDDAVLIKDNHRVLAGSVGEAVRRARALASHVVKIEVEVDTLEQLDEALALDIDVVLLDNMSIDMLREAVSRCRGQALTEASGGITPRNARAVAEAGVDVISLGWLTHSAPALDVALDLR